MTHKELQKLIEDPAIPDEKIFELLKKGLDEDKSIEPPTQTEQDDISAFGELCQRLRPELMLEWQARFAASHFQVCEFCRKGFEEQSKENSGSPLEARIRERINHYLKKEEHHEH